MCFVIALLYVCQNNLIETKKKKKVLVFTKNYFSKIFSQYIHAFFLLIFFKFYSRICVFTRITHRPHVIISSFWTMLITNRTWLERFCLRCALQAWLNFALVHLRTNQINDITLLTKIYCRYTIKNLPYVILICYLRV